jgi:hypothetical protein
MPPLNVGLSSIQNCYQRRKRNEVGPSASQYPQDTISQELEIHNERHFKQSQKRSHTS